LLQTHFDQLQGTITLDQEVIERYQRTYEALAKPATTPEQRKRAAVELERYMRAYIQGLDPDA
jgi:hypothetical protein